MPQGPGVAAARSAGGTLRLGVATKRGPDSGGGELQGVPRHRGAWEMLQAGMEQCGVGASAELVSQLLAAGLATGNHGWKAGMEQTWGSPGPL